MTLFANADAQNNWTASLTKGAGASKEIHLNGLYDVYIDMEDDVDLNDLDRVDDITNCAWR